MVQLFKYISRLSVVVIIFFSLQGEVVLRYAEMFGSKHEQNHKVSKSTNERQRLIKLQCFTQKFQLVGLPPDLNFTFKRPVKLLEPIDFSSFEIDDVRSSCSIPLYLRGPPLRFT